MKNEFDLRVTSSQNETSSIQQCEENELKREGEEIDRWIDGWIVNQITHSFIHINDLKQ